MRAAAAQPRPSIGSGPGRIHCPGYSMVGSLTAAVCAWQAARWPRLPCELERISAAIVGLLCPIALFPATSEREKIRFHQNAARALECRERHRRAGRRRRRRKEECEEMYEEFKAA